MNKSELAELIHIKNKFLSKKDVNESLNIIIEFISDNLANSKRIEVRGFGTFSSRKRARRIARNPKTGTSVEVGNKLHPYFRAAKSLKDILKD